MSLKTPLARARGLGSAKDGSHHWWAQRMTALALVPLTIWFVAAVVSLAGEGRAAVAAWVGEPLNTVLLLLLIGATFHHLQAGIQVVVEDYIHGELTKIATLVAVKFASFGLAVASGYAVLKVAFGG